MPSERFCLPPLRPTCEQHLNAIQFKHYKHFDIENNKEKQTEETHRESSKLMRNLAANPYFALRIRSFISSP